jgi:hypothetical protein
MNFALKIKGIDFRKKEKKKELLARDLPQTLGFELRALFFWTDTLPLEPCLQPNFLIFKNFIL